MNTNVRRVVVVLAMAWIFAFLVFTELMARELFFGALYANGLLLFAETDLNRRLVPVFGTFYVWLFLMGFQAGPGTEFW